MKNLVKVILALALLLGILVACGDELSGTWEEDELSGTWEEDELSGIWETDALGFLISVRFKDGKFSIGQEMDRDGEVEWMGEGVEYELVVIDDMPVGILDTNTYLQIVGEDGRIEQWRYKIDDDLLELEFFPGVSFRKK